METPKIKNYTLKNRRKKKYKMNIDPNEYQVGDWVNVKATSKSDYKNKKKIIATTVEPTPLWGRIVGIKKFFTGTYNGCKQTLDCHWLCPDVEYEDPYLTNIKTVYLWEIKLGLLNKPILALPENITRAIGVLDGDIPVFYSERTEWTKESKNRLRDEIKDIPRDEKGRWKRIP
jgi:hypothetical protein